MKRIGLVLIFWILAGCAAAAGMTEAPRPAGAGNLFARTPALLAPDMAFTVSARREAADRAVLTLAPQPGYYLYRDRIRVALLIPAAAGGPVVLPPGVPKEDPNFGRMEVYPTPVRIPVPLAASAAGQPVAVEVAYQGCADSGVCYPPQHKRLMIAAEPAPPAATPGTDPADTTGIAGLLANQSQVVVLLSFFGFGLLLAFTPCMLPMLPIISGLLAGQAGQLSRWRGLQLSGSYVLGMALTYALAGVAAGLSGALLSVYLQTPWILGGFAAIFVVLALAMFGVFTLQMPASLQAAVSGASNRLHGGRHLPVFGMGALSALLVGPCMAAPLAGALLYIGNTGDVWLGGAALFTMAVGMGMPLLALGASSGWLLPRAGRWMEAVKTFFGLVLLATAIWLVTPVLLPALVMILWAAWCFLGAWLLLSAAGPVGQAFLRPLRRIAGVLLISAGALQVYGAVTGAADPVVPWAAEGAAGTPPPFIPVRSVADLEAQLGKGPAMLEFNADWCISCKIFERKVLTRPEVKTALSEVRLLRADVTQVTEADRALLRRFHLYGPPALIFFDAAGREALQLRTVGEVDADTFTARIRELVP